MQISAFSNPFDIAFNLIPPVPADLTTAISLPSYALCILPEYISSVFGFAEPAATSFPAPSTENKTVFTAFVTVLPSISVISTVI